jgi:hypothetical protein
MATAITGVITDVHHYGYDDGRRFTLSENGFSFGERWAIGSCRRVAIEPESDCRFAFTRTQDIP